MATALALTTEAMARELLSNRPFSLHGPDSFWLVERGKLYVFLSRMEDDECAEARYPVMAVEPGEAIFGMPVIDSGKPQLLASAAPGTRVVQSSQQNVRELAASGDERAIEMLESWVTRLGTALASSAVPVSPVNLEPGHTTEVKNKPHAVIPKKGIVWVLHRKGSSQFLADQSLPAVNHGMYFPVSARAWIQPQPGSVLECIPSQQLSTVDSEWQGLSAFHEMALCALYRGQATIENKERTQLRAKMDSDAALMEHGLLQLASVLAPKELAKAVPEECVSDPLLLACRIVGRRLNLKISPPRNLPTAAAHKEPILDIAKASSLRLRRVMLKGEWWKHDSGPLVSFGEQDHRPVALLPGKSGGYELHDSAQPQPTRVNADLAQSLNPFAYVFYRPFPAKKITGKELLLFGFKGSKAELLTIFGLSIASGIVGVAIPYAAGIIFDVLLPGAERTQLTQLTAFLVVAALSTGMFALSRGFATLRLEGKMDAALQAAVWDRLLSLPLQFFRDYSAGDLAMRSLGIAQIRQMLTGSTLNTILSGVFSIFSVAILFYYEWRLALLATGLIALGFLTTIVFGYFQVRLQRRISKLRGSIAGTVLQFINGIGKLRGSGAEGRAFVSWARHFTDQRQQSMDARRIVNGLTVFTSVYPIVSIAFIFFYHSYLISGLVKTTMTTGDFVAFLTAFMQCMAAASLFSASVLSLANIVPLYERAQPILHTLPEVTGARTDPGQLTGAIELNHVRFRYAPDAPLVLRDISASIKPGEMVAFVGPSGCGKSTLFRLLLGFEAPESGAIYYDGQDLSGVDVQAVRQQMGVVLQSSRLLSGDVFTNIVGSSSLTLDDAWEAARQAGIEDDIRRMPMGMHTMISEGGGGISGGQRQRLLLARAIVNRPRILLLDEATSALDNQTQAIVSRSLEKLHTTRIVIAHRLSTIMGAHRIFVIDRGEVVQCGSYQELLNQKGMFQELAMRQLL
jgi:NHLM bacteriocin system ABC transporter ATP-binding protein